jgi:hypothetical protein
MFYWQAEGAKVHMIFLEKVWYISEDKLSIPFDSLHGQLNSPRPEHI